MSDRFSTVLFNRVPPNDGNGFASSPFRACRSLLLGLFLGAVLVAAAAEEPKAPPPLAVVISIDQCRADYLERFRPFFGQGGFERLLGAGMDFTECHQRHAVTNTAPGHATILTGVHANIHGIISNEWRDPVTLAPVGAVEDPNSPLVGYNPAPGEKPRPGRSPHRLLATTVGDQLKLRFPATSHVVALSAKDRQAILLGGRLADAAYWLEAGQFVTSTYYRKELPAWVAEFNRGQHVEKDFGRVWDRALPEDAYNRVQGADDAPGEESRLGLGTTFPRKVDGGSAQLTSKFYDAYRLTPFLGDLIVEFAKQAIAAEKLGRHETSDLLCIGFPQVDYAGHSYGPDSHEVMDLLIRLDRSLAELFGYLDREVGAGRYVVVLTADHGVTPLPERVQAFGRGVAAGRFAPADLVHGIELELTRLHGSPAPASSWVVRDSYGLRIVPAALQGKKVRRDELTKEIRDLAAAFPQIQQAFTREEVLATPPGDQSVLGRIRLSYYPQQSQDVVFFLKPYVVDRDPAGTNHGCPYDCDDHVPLLFFGPGVPHGTRTDRVGVDNLAPTLSALLKIPTPPQAQAGRLF